MKKWMICTALACAALLAGSAALAANGTWHDSEVKYKRTIVVDNAKRGGFSSLAAAYASIDPPTFDKPVLIKIMPGTYDIGALVLDKNYVDIQGTGVGITVLNAVVPDYGNHDALFLTAMARLSDFTLDLNFGPNRADAGIVTALHTYSYQSVPPVLSDLVITSHFQDNVAWPMRMQVNGLYASASNMLKYSLDARNITVNLNLPAAVIEGYGVMTYGKASLSDMNIVATGTYRVYGLVLGMSNNSTLNNVHAYASTYAFMPNGTNNFLAFDSSFVSPTASALLANNGANGEIVDSVVDGHIYDPLDRDSPTDAGVVLTNCVDGNGAPLIFPY